MFVTKIEILKLILDKDYLALKKAMPHYKLEYKNQLTYFADRALGVESYGAIPIIMKHEKWEYSNNHYYLLRVYQKTKDIELFEYILENGNVSDLFSISLQHEDFERIKRVIIKYYCPIRSKRYIEKKATDKKIIKFLLYFDEVYIRHRTEKSYQTFVDNYDSLCKMSKTEQEVFIKSL